MCPLPGCPLKEERPVGRLPGRHKSLLRDKRGKVSGLRARLSFCTREYSVLPTVNAYCTSKRGQRCREIRCAISEQLADVALGVGLALVVKSHVLLQLPLRPPGEEGLRVLAEALHLVQRFQQRRAQRLWQEDGQKSPQEGARAHQQQREGLEGQGREVKGHL